MSAFKPVMLLMDRPRERSPLLTQFYGYLARADGMFRIVRDNRTDMPLKDIIEDRLDGPPDFVYWGFTPGTGLKRSAKYVKENNIKIICDVGDVEQFVGGYGPVVDNFRETGIDYLIARWPDVEGFHSSVDLREHVSKMPWLNRAEIIHVPWAIDPSLYYEGERDIDASLVCTMNPMWHYHENRTLARYSLAGIPANIRVGNWYGAEYLDILSRSKIFIVEGSGRNFLVQKYLEGAASGAMLMGEIPGTAQDVFEDGISIAEVKDYSRVGEQVLDYLKRPEDIKRIAGEGRERVLEKFALDKIVPAFENAIWKS